MRATIRLLMQALSPVTQGEGAKGNELLIRREPVQTPLGTRFVPVLTGNSLRHRMLREPLAEHLVREWGLAGTLSKEQVRFLYNGGALGGEHGASLGRIAEVERLLPMVALLGASLPDAILPGRLRMGMCWLVCAETLGQIRRDTPPEWWPINDARDVALQPAETFVSRSQYYRHDAVQRRPDLLAEGEADDLGSGMMPHAGEAVCAGSEWYLRIDAERCDDVTLGALLFGLAEWCLTGSTVGGQSSRGHGRMSPTVDLGGLDADGLISAYRDHVAANREDGTALLRSLWAKPAKGAA
jgi:hypothetical protein